MTNRRNSPLIRTRQDEASPLFQPRPAFFITFKNGLASIVIPVVPNVLPSFDNLVSYWSMDNVDLGSVLDVMGLNDGTNINALTGEDGQVDEAFLFDGASSYISVPNDISFESAIGPSGQMSFSTWINTNNIGAQQHIIAKYDFTNGERAWSFTIEPSGQIRFLVTDPSITNFDSLISTPVVTANIWTHVGFTWDNSQTGIDSKVQLYIDGVAVDGYQSTSGGTFSEIQGTISDVLIGAVNPPTPQDFFDGYMDEVLIFDNVITSNEMGQLYNNGVDGYRFVTTVADPTSYWTLDNADLSGSTVLDVIGTNDGTETSTTTGQVGIVNESFAFNGSTSEITVPDDISLDPELESYAGSCWFRLEALPGSAQMLISKRGGAGAFDNFTLYVRSTDVLTVECSDNVSGTPFDLISNSESLVIGPWYHGFFRIDRATSQLELYQDGEFVGRTDLTVGSLENSTGLQIGKESASAFLDGNIDEVAVWKGAIPDGYAAPKILYNYGVPNIPTPVFALSFDDADTSGGTLTDKTFRGNDGTITGGITTGGTGQIGQSYDFNGTGHINHGNMSELDFTTATPFSISYWYNAADLTAVTNPAVISKYNFAVGSGWQCAMEPSGDYFALGLATSTYTVGRVVRTSSVPPSGGVWHHALVTYDGSNTAAGINWYIDGIEVSTTIVRDTDPGNISNSEDVLVGANLNSSVPSTFWEDSLDELYVFAEELDARQVAYIYAEGAKGRVLI